MANKYRITMNGRYRADAVIVTASTPATAIKRLLDGGHDAGYKFATVGPNRVKLAIGEAIWLRCERVKGGA